MTNHDEGRGIGLVNIAVLIVFFASTLLGIALQIAPKVPMAAALAGFAEVLQKNTAAAAPDLDNACARLAPAAAIGRLAGRG